MTSLIRFFSIAPLFIIPFLPLYSEGSLFFPFITGKAFAFRILVEIAAGAWLLLALSDKAYRPKFSWPLIIYGALVAWMFVADLLAVNPHKAFWSNYERMDGFVTLMHVFVFFVVAGSVLTGSLFKKWWLTVLAASVFVAAHGVLQLLGAAQIHQGGVRLDANLGNAAYLAAYLLFIIGIALWQAFESKGWLRGLLFFLAGTQVILLLATATRGAILALVAASLCGALLYAFSSGARGRKIGVGVLAGILLVVGVFMLIRDTEFIRNDPALARVASISLEDGSTRFTLWRMAAQGALERPLFGWGHEGFNYVFTKYYDPSLYAQEPWFDRAHNVFVDWLIYGGVPALLMFVALLISGALALYQSSATRIAKVMLVAALAAYAFQALFVFDNLMSYVMFAAILAYAHALAARPVHRFVQMKEVPQKTLQAVAVPAVAALTLAVVFFVNVPGIMGGQALIRALAARQDVSNSVGHFTTAINTGTFATQEVREQLVSYAAMVFPAPAVSSEAKKNLAAFAFSEIEKEITKVPEDARLKIMYAQAREAAGDYAGTVALLEEARALSPKKQTIILQIGLESWKLGDKEKAHRYFTEAYELDTRNKEAALYAAAGDIITGDAEGGLALLGEAYGTTTVNHDIIRFAFTAAGMFPELLQSAYRRVLEEGTADARFYYARALATTGKFSEARAYIEATIAAFPSARAIGEELLRQIESGK